MNFQITAKTGYGPSRCGKGFPGASFRYLLSMLLGWKAGGSIFTERASHTETGKAPARIIHA
jgi:hypothetical protein